MSIHGDIEKLVDQCHRIGKPAVRKLATMDHEIGRRTGACLNEAIVRMDQALRLMQRVKEEPDTPHKPKVEKVTT